MTTLGASAAFMERSIERKIKDLPALPSAVMKVLEETEKPEPNQSLIEKYIVSDAGLTAKVLRVVNSAYYGLSRQVTSVSQAIMILGLQQVRNLVLSVASISTFQAKTARQQETLKSFWIHSFSTAAATQQIGRIKGFDVRTNETAFIGGLLHDIGRLFLYCNFTEVYDRLLEAAAKEQRKVEECELTMLGMTHAELGLQISTKWGLPEILVDMIGRHEGPFAPGDDPYVMSVHVADAVTKHLYFDETMPQEFHVDPVAWAWLDLSNEAFEMFKLDATNRVAAAAEMFGMMAA